MVINFSACSELIFKLRLQSTLKVITFKMKWKICEGSCKFGIS